MIAYASQTLTKSESNYSVECFATVFGMKLFIRMLLYTGDRPRTTTMALGTKMEGLLQR